MKPRPKMFSDKLRGELEERGYAVTTNLASAVAKGAIGKMVIGVASFCPVPGRVAVYLLDLGDNMIMELGGSVEQDALPAKLDSARKLVVEFQAGVKGIFEEETK